MKKNILVAILCATAFYAGQRATAQPKNRLGAFMKQKLKHSQALLEGLVMEDFEMVAINAKALNTLSNQADWEVLPSLEYVRQSQEFQRLTNALTREANDKDLDGSTLTYVQLTINCVNCHKYVRTQQERR